VPIHFLGVWDTVGSVIAPGAFWLIPKILRMVHLWSNPSVGIFRQAAAIDEKRRMFRLEPWIITPPKTADEAEKAKQVWFAGYHSDVGGGFAAEGDDVSDFPLRWMIGEAKAAQLDFDLKMVDRLLNGVPYREQPADYATGAKADPVGSKIHDSMKLGWWPLEYLPNWTSRPVWPKRIRWLPWRGYVPRSEPRIIPDGAMVHWSAVERKVDSGAAYQPENWPAMLKIESDMAVVSTKGNADI